MSLINEALKRAESERLQRGAAGDQRPAPVHFKRDSDSRPRRTFPLVLVLAVLAAAAVAFGVWRAIGSPWPTGLPVSASAVVVSQADAPTTRPAQPQTRPAAAPHIEADPEVREIIDKSIAAVTYYTPPDPPPAPEPGVAAGEPPAAAKQAQSPPPAADPPPAPPQPKVDPSSFTLSGILMGADGGTAIVNGRFLKVGQTIDDAKVVTITPKTVYLEVAGKLITLGL